MTTLRDMPMITIEQQNRFREAALQVEAERDALAAHVVELVKGGRALHDELQQWSLTERDPETSAAMAKWRTVVGEQLDRDHHAEITSRERVQAELAAVKAERDGLGRMVHDKAVQLQRAERALHDACDYLGSNRLNTIGSGSQLHRQMVEALDDNANNRF